MDVDFKKEIFDVYYNIMKIVVMMEEKLVCEVEIDKVKDIVKEVYVEKFLEYEEEV